MSFRNSLRRLLGYPSHVTTRRVGRKTPSYRPVLEDLESRRVLSDFSLGTLAGRTVGLNRLVLAGETDNFTFILNTPAEVDVQLATDPIRDNCSGLCLPEAYTPDLDIILRSQGASDVLASSSHIPVQLNPPTFGQKAFEQFRVKVPAGSY